MPNENTLPTPVTMNQKFLAKAAGMEVELPTAITMDQMYLQAIAEGSGGGSGDAYTKEQTDALLAGKADLENGKVPAAQLPSYVDDVLEYSSTSAFPVTGESGKIYVATDTNKTYRWSGSGYTEISESLALGETASTAYAGNKGKANADAIAAIKDGTNIDSFADVETALAAKLNTADVDAALSDTSTNPVQNKAVASALTLKQVADPLTPDMTTTAPQDFANVTGGFKSGQLFAAIAKTHVQYSNELNYSFLIPHATLYTMTRYPVFANGVYCCDVSFYISENIVSLTIYNYKSSSNFSITNVTVYAMG